MLKYLALTFAFAFAMAQQLQIIKDFVPENCSALSKNGDKLYMHYTGSIDESSATGVKGQVFDSSLKRGKPFDFPLGAGRVIQVNKQNDEQCMGIIR